MDFEKRVLHIEKDKLKIRGEEYSLEDIATKKSYEFISDSADFFSSGEIYDNILFYVFIIDVLVARHFLIENNVKDIIFENAEMRLQKVFMAASNNIGVSIREDYKPEHFSASKFKLILYAAKIYLLFCSMKVHYKPVNISTDADIAVIRTSAAKSKIHKKENRILLYESGIGKGTFYQDRLQGSLQYVFWLG